MDIPGNLVHSPVTVKDIIGRTAHWCLFDGGTQLGGALWFLQVLFQISALYVVLEFLFRQIFPDRWVLSAQSLLSLLLLGAGFACHLNHWSIWLLDIALTAYPLYHLGVLLHHLSALPHRPAGIALCGAGSALILGILQNFGSISLASNEYPNPLFLLLCSLCGWYVVYAIAQLALHLSFLRRLLNFAGRHSRTILILHLLCFKPVSWIGLQLTGGESYLLAAFPVLFTGGAWWIAYTAIGFLLPLGIQRLYLLLQKKMQKTDKAIN